MLVAPVAPAAVRFVLGLEFRFGVIALGAELQRPTFRFRPATNRALPFQVVLAPPPCGLSVTVAISHSPSAHYVGLLFCMPSAPLSVKLRIRPVVGAIIFAKVGEVFGSILRVVIANLLSARLSI